MSTIVTTLMSIPKNCKAGARYPNSAMTQTTKWIMGTQWIHLIFLSDGIRPSILQVSLSRSATSETGTAAALMEATRQTRCSVAVVALA